MCAYNRELEQENTGLKRKQTETKMWNRKLNKRIDWILFRIEEIEDTQKKILELMKQMSEKKTEK